jgi:hypothetical protein
MKSPSLTTSVYKYKRYAPWMVVAYLVATVLLFSMSEYLPSWFILIAVTFFISIPIYTAIYPKSIFSLRSVDERQLTLNPDEIVWGNWLVPIHDVSNLSVYIFAFDTFQHYQFGPKTKNIVTEYGDKNKLEFTYRGVQYDLTFYLGNFEHYHTLVQIIEVWRADGINLSARSAFADEYIREQVRLHGN